MKISGFLNIKNRHAAQTVMIAMTLLSSSQTTLAHSLRKLYDAKGNLLNQEELHKVESKAQEALVIDPNAAKKANERFYSIEIQTFTGLNSYSTDVLDITKSYLGITLGSADYAQFLNNFSESSKHTTVVQFSAKFSLIPALFLDTAKNNVIKDMDAKAEQVRAQYLAGAAVKIHQKISQLIQNNTINQSEGQVMEAKFISSAKNIIDSQISEARANHTNKLVNRVESIQNDYSFQEFALKISHKAFSSDEGALLIFGQVGKAAINGGLEPNSGINSLTPLVWWGPRGMRTESTGTVQLGLEWITKNDIKVGVEAYFFHDRPQGVSGRLLANDLIYMDNAQFEQQRQFWEINSNLERFYVKMPSKIAKTEDQFFLSTADYNGKRAFGAGTLIRIMPKLSMEVDVALNRPQFDYAITESLLFHANDRLTLYFLNENTRNIRHGFDGDNTPKFMSVSSAGVGATYRLVEIRFVGIRGSVDVNAECRYFYEDMASTIQAQLGCGGGILLNAQY